MRWLLGVPVLGRATSVIAGEVPFLTVVQHPHLVATFPRWPPMSIPETATPVRSHPGNTSESLVRARSDKCESKDLSPQNGSRSTENLY